MVRASLCSVALLAVFTFAVRAEEKKDTKQAKATITKVDTKSGTVTVKMKDKEGKDIEKTFKLAEDIVYLDSTGKAARIDLFRTGDEVLVVEQEGKLKQLKKGDKKPGEKDK